MKIAVDVFGGDYAPDEVIEGIKLALEKDSKIEIVAVGDENKIKEKLKSIPNSNRVSILDAKEVIDCDDNPATAIMKKRKSSIVVGLKYVKDVNNNVKAFVSAGSTGALLTGAYIILQTIPGIERPALAPVLPTFNGTGAILIDAGANSECTPLSMYGFAQMGREYAREVLKIEKPTVGILSNGVEDTKGTKLVQEAAKLIKDLPGIEYVGQMEARDLLTGKYNVIVADGFSGNIALKASEGMAKGLLSSLKDAIKNGPFLNKLAGLILKKSLNGLKNRLDYTENGGAVFLGVNTVLIKVHGSAKANSFCASILQARDIIKSDLLQKIKNGVENDR